MTRIPFDFGVHAAPARAEASGTLGAPLRIYAADDGYGTGVTFFCNDDALARDLAEAINAVIEKHKAKASRPALTLVKPEPA